MSDSRYYNWYKLDNAATIVPATATGPDTRVFRIVCELTEDVDPVTLQSAVESAMEDYPHLNSVLKKGFFWYYLSHANITPTVTEDFLPECAPIYHPGRHELLYRVTYFRRRINLEMFHAIADGTGAIMFLKDIVSTYLQKRHDLTLPPEDDASATADEKVDDAFARFYDEDMSKGMDESLTFPKAYQIKQIRDENLRPHLIEGTVPADGFMKLAKENGTTAGVLSVSLFIESIIETMPRASKKRPIIISVPVNLRKYYASETARNFFGVIPVAYDPAAYNGSLDSIIKEVKESFARQLNPESLGKTMNGYTQLERNLLLKAIPLFIKEVFISIAAHKAKQGVTATLSNLGKVTMPEPLCHYIDSFSAYMSTPDLQICVSTFGNKMVFGTVSAYEEHSVLVHFFRKLSGYGLEVTIGTNDYDVPIANKEKPNRKQVAIKEKLCSNQVAITEQSSGEQVEIKEQSAIKE